MAPKTNLRCGGAHLERIETQVTRAALIIQKIDCMAVLFMNSRAREIAIVAWSPAAIFPGGEEQKTHFNILSRHES